MTTSSVTELSPQEVQELLRKGETTMIDVRTDVEFAEQFVADCRHIPLDQLSSAVSELNPNRHYSLLCLGGKRAARAAGILSDLGYSHLAIVSGGLENWKQCGLPCETPRRRALPLMRQVQLIVGVLSLVTSILAIFVNPLFAAVPAVLGLGLTIAGSTGWCGLAFVLAKMPWNRVPASAAPSSCCLNPNR
ncbi:DUF2892 domain-containing protein [Luteolibacter pohnpeiensis]|uniref:DUF2892 domain-containing protein n=1 Tax=Luteolibacter pohnpeiensis TaxID=454153 RepID=A0A934S4H3_9BACT|nr:rhodanese-like domain-containing protein [Luteolibacter pohnpeiensis]MBK1881743.1 DUF2892 domain-containing protein [Luteolibacter pohnpeiensis]